MLKSFSIENYRAFAKQQEVELKPITLIFGWNSGGKSALVRFLPLLSESIANQGAPIWLSGDVGRQATWDEIICKSTERDSLKFRLSWDDGQIKAANWDISGDLEGRWQEVNRLEVEFYDTKNKIILDRDEKSAWAGLLPDEFDFKESLEKILNDLKDNVQWISGIRTKPPRISIFNGSINKKIKYDGSDAINHLISDQLNGKEKSIIPTVNSFFSKLGNNLVIDSPTPGCWRILLQPVKSSFQVNICDTGEGYSQVLPILVALARAQQNGPNILCLEQPELHLHTKAQLELSNQIIKAAKENAKLLIETHSEVLLTSIQLAIAEKSISCNDVRVYWLEANENGTSELTTIDFDELGQPSDSALSAAFSEAVTLGRKLLKHQIAGI